MRDVFARPVETYCNILGIECEVAVEVDYQPEEPASHDSRGCAAQAAVTTVWYEDEGCQLNNMLQHDIDELEQRMLELGAYRVANPPRAMLPKKAKYRLEIERALLSTFEPKRRAV
jgi:hypothetical protein